MDYPTEQELTEIKAWKWIPEKDGSDIAFIDRLLEIWHWNDRCSFKKFKNGKWKLYLTTGGWSGNEDIIRTMQSQEQPNFFFWFWQKSERGGHYWFERDFRKAVKEAFESGQKAAIKDLEEKYGTDLEEGRFGREL